jgi:N-acetylglucosaminyl-diphospho-decaprenol L-rhamnosyltransferase
VSEPSEIILSVIIVSYNTADHLRRCLLSLEAFAPSTLHEVIVIDNASSDGSCGMVERAFPKCRLIRSNKNEGYGVAINEAVQHANGQYLMFLNPDIEVSPGSLDSLLAFAKSHPRAGLVGPRLVLSDGTPQASARRRVTAALLLLETSRFHLLLPARLRGRLMLGVYDAQTDTRKVDWISGACHLIPRRVWQDVGYLTEETFCGFDDYDYCYRVWKCGWEVWLYAAATMTHHCSVAVRNRWTTWEVEQVAIHNSYVILSSHWPPWRVKWYALAELVAYGSEYLRHALIPRKGVENVEEDYGRRVKRRFALTWHLLVGRQKPIRRFQP